MSAVVPPLGGEAGPFIDDSQDPNISFWVSRYSPEMLHYPHQSTWGPHAYNSLAIDLARGIRPIRVALGDQTGGEALAEKLANEDGILYVAHDTPWVRTTREDRLSFKAKDAPEGRRNVLGYARVARAAGSKLLEFTTLESFDHDLGSEHCRRIALGIASSAIADYPHVEEVKFHGRKDIPEERSKDFFVDELGCSKPWYVRKWGKRGAYLRGNAFDVQARAAQVFSPPLARLYSPSEMGLRRGELGLLTLVKDWTEDTDPDGNYQAIDKSAMGPRNVEDEKA